jgi:hypothetical protein
MRSSTVLLLGLSSAISLGLADVCQAETFTGRYIIVSETSDIGGSISGYIVFEDAIISNKLALPHEYDRGVKEVSITYSQPGMGTMTVDLSDYKDLAGQLSLDDIIGFDGVLGAPVLTPVFHNPISTSASWEFYGDLMGDGEIKDTLKLSVFNVDGDPSTPGQTRWTVMIDDVSNSPDLGTDWALRTFSPVWWLVLDTDSDDKSPAIANAKQNGLDNSGNRHAR